VVGPDTKLYACVPSANKIVRMNQDGTGFEVVYEATGPTDPRAPQCGRFSARGDLLFSTKSPYHTGVWKITREELENLPTAPVPTQIVNSFGADADNGEGLAITPQGDLLMVHQRSGGKGKGGGSGDRVLKSVISSSAVNASQLISGLNKPFGLARNSVGEIFVAEWGTKSIKRFNANGSADGTCASFSGQEKPFYLEIAADDSIYVVTSLGNNLNSLKGGKLRKFNAMCSTVTTLLDLGSSGAELIGVALDATSVASPAKTFSPSIAINFGSNAAQLDLLSCTNLVVRAIHTPPGSLAADLAASGITGRPVPNSGEGGFEIVYEIVEPADCTILSFDGKAALTIAGFFNVQNPRIVRCPADAPRPSTGYTDCAVQTLTGYWPIAVLLGTPGDPIKSGVDFPSRFFLIDEELNEAPEVSGQFCGFESPLTNTDLGDAPASFSPSGTIPVKFLLATRTGNCSTGPFITDAQAIISVARVEDAGGNLVFNPIDVLASGNSNTPPLFRNENNPNKQYIFNLDITGYAPGLYTVTVTFTSNNEVAKTTLMRIVE
jgi:hypothetical protein